MKNMKKLVAALLVMTMVVALATTAFAACKIKKGMYVEFKCDSAAYTAAKESKKTKSVVEKGSTALCNKVCGKFARLIVNEAAGTEAWFKTCDLKESDVESIWVFWAKGGKGMSTCRKGTIMKLPGLKGMKLIVTGHTNLRKNCGMKFKSQGVVEKCDKLKSTGYIGWDDRGVMWFQVCKGGKKLWVSSNFIKATDELVEVLVDYFEEEA